MLFMTNQTYGSPADDELKIQISSALVGDCRIDHSTTWSTSEQKKNIDFRRNNRYKIAIIAEPNFVLFDVSDHLESICKTSAKHVKSLYQQNGRILKIECLEFSENRSGIRLSIFFCSSIDSAD